MSGKTVEHRRENHIAYMENPYNLYGKTVETIRENRREIILYIKLLEDYLKNIRRLKEYCDENATFNYRHSNMSVFIITFWSLWLVAVSDAQQSPLGSRAFPKVAFRRLNPFACPLRGLYRVSEERLTIKSQAPR